MIDVEAKTQREEPKPAPYPWQLSDEQIAKLKPLAERILPLLDELIGTYGEMPRVVSVTFRAVRTYLHGIAGIKEQPYERP